VNNRTSVTDTITGLQHGVEAFTYDALDRVTRITQSGVGVTAKRVDMTYDAASQMTGVQRYSDLAGTLPVVNTAYVYDAAGRLTALNHAKNSTPIANYGFTYDAANRLAKLITPDGTSDYSYNPRDELTATNHSNQTDESYSYDDTGNRKNAGYVTGDHNRLLSDGTYNYAYDNEGNRTRRVAIATGEVTEYGWDTRNRMTSVVTKASGGSVIKAVEYTYDVYDRRIAKSVDGDGSGPAAATQERFVYDGDHIALVFDGAGNQASRYLHGPQIDQVLAEETAAGVRWALADHQGSVRDVTGSQGTVLNHLTYDSYGQVTSETHPEVDFRFGYTGRERDEETGLDYYRARYFAMCSIVRATIPIQVECSFHYLHSPWSSLLL
jgi:YD repeat-containing protein